ncbi:two-component system, NtrC family, sensor kinase [Janthinobacterium sp. CG_23.3]|uniref:response regulator n=1 Tax=unclassified Janthinobacterium TaxID=2610881 RepID=UPI00034D500F|nr:MULTISPECIES: response regulator [unclassified Janthinobacterium]MEC5159287.1 two-component system NtrC family sensor kinase [Janthinobacterium sp. CG_S6]
MNPATVLIIDDTPANVAVLADYLEDQGLRVVVAQDGEEGLERAQFVRPDLILLDVMMPGMDGFETCRQLKLRAELKDIPVIFMTALTDSSNVVNGFAVGGVDYVTKPIQIEEVLARINTHLSMRAMHQQLSEQNLVLRQEVAMRLQTEAELQLVSDEQQLLIAKLQQAHDQLLQSEKMASIGQLAAGIAHEINNPIGFVNSNMGAVQGYFDTLFKAIDACGEAIAQGPDQRQIAARFGQLKQAAEFDYLKDDFAELMKESLEGLKRVKDIVQALKDFSHVGESNWLAADLHRGLDSTLNIVNNEIKYKAEVVKQYGQLPLVKCLASQLNQVFMNLLVNAAHAIKEFGVITIRTGCSGADWVWVEISDTGQGIPADIMKRIFEPFFTTKAVGSGTGLGLSLSYGIVNKHGGRIEVRSEPGQGCCFTVHLPVNPP